MKTNDPGGAAGVDPVAEQLARIRDLFEQARELFSLGEISLAMNVRNAAVRLHAELERAICGPRATRAELPIENPNSRR